MKFWIKQITSLGIEYWVRVSSRERVFISLGVFLATVLLGYYFLVSPFFDRLRTLDRLILRKEKEIVEIGPLRDQYLVLKQKISSVEDRIARGQGGFSLFSYLEGIAQKNRIKEKIVFIRPQPSQVLGDFRELAVEVKLESVSLAQVVNLLDAIQGSPEYVRIKRAQLKTRYNDPRLLDGTFVVASYERTS